MSRISMSLFLAAGMLTAGTALAAPVYVGHIRFQDSYGNGSGGEFQAYGLADFTITPAATGLAFQFGPAFNGAFETFCLEKYEGLDIPSPLDPNEEYKADLNTETVTTDIQYAGGNYGGYNDALDARTAYLYSNFIAQTLAGYNYGNGLARQNSANDLQDAIWAIEQEIDRASISSGAEAFIAMAEAAIAGGSWSGLGSVRVLNIYTNSIRRDYQDVLVSTTIIPLPGTAALAGLGLGGLAVVRRRRAR